jgi:hypothetical protein
VDRRFEGKTTKQGLINGMGVKARTRQGGFRFQKMKKKIRKHSDSFISSGMPPRHW